MPEWKAVIEKFGKKGDKSGWSYLLIPAEIAIRMNPASRKSFKVKGLLDAVPINGVSLSPAGEGDYILPLNAQLRKQLGKQAGAEVVISIEKDDRAYELNQELMICLNDDEDALKFFTSFPLSHQRYFSKHVESAKTAVTREKRIVQILKAMMLKQTFAEMIRSNKDNR